MYSQETLGGLKNLKNMYLCNFAGVFLGYDVSDISEVQLSKLHEQQANQVSGIIFHKKNI